MKSLLYKVLALPVASACAIAALAGEPASGGGCPGAFAQLVKAFDKPAALRAHFRHALAATTLDQNEVEEGTVTLAPGGRMRWEYTRPAGKLAVADGKTSTLYLPENREAFVQPLDPGGPLLFRLLAGQVKLEEELACEGVTAQGDRAVMELRLIKRDAEVRKVEVTIVAATGQVVQVRYKDPLGNEVSLALSDIQRPVSVPEGYFLFKAPPGTRIIRAQ